MSVRVHHVTPGYPWLVNAAAQVMLLTNKIGPWAVGDLARHPAVFRDPKTGVLGPMPNPSKDLDKALTDGTAVLTNPPRKNRRGCLCATVTFDKSVTVVMADEKRPVSMREQVQDFIDRHVVPVVEAKLKELTVGTKREASLGGYAEIHPHMVNSLGGLHFHVDVYFYNVALKPDQTVGCVRNFTDKLFHGAASFNAQIQRGMADFLQGQGLKVSLKGDNVVVDAVPRVLCEQLSVGKQLAREMAQAYDLAPGFKGTQYANLLIRKAAEITHYRVPATLAALSTELRGQVEHAAVKARVSLPEVRAEIDRQRNVPGVPIPWAEESFAAYTQSREAVKALPGPVTAEQLKTFLFLASIDFKRVSHKGMALVADLATRRPESFDLKERPVQSKDDARAVVVRYMPEPPVGPPPPPPTGVPQAREVPPVPAQVEPRPSREDMKRDRTWEEFGKAAFATAAEVFKSGAQAARAAVKVILQKFEPFEYKMTIATGRELERFLRDHKKGDRDRAHLAGLFAFARAHGNPHERAVPAEHAYDRVRTRERLRKGTVLVIENLHGELTDKERKALKTICDKDKATLKVLEPIDMHNRHQDRVRHWMAHDTQARQERAARYRTSPPPPPPPPPPPSRGR